MTTDPRLEAACRAYAIERHKTDWDCLPDATRDCESRAMQAALAAADAVPQWEWCLVADDPAEGHGDEYAAMDEADPDDGVIVELHGAAVVNKFFGVRLPEPESDEDGTQFFDTREEAEAAVAEWRARITAPLPSAPEGVGGE